MSTPVLYGSTSAIEFKFGPIFIANVKLGKNILKNNEILQLCTFFLIGWKNPANACLMAINECLVKVENPTYFEQFIIF